MSIRKEIEALACFAVGNGLNIGCGNIQIGYSLGVDISKDARAAIIHCDATKLPFEDDHFDYIVSAANLEHFACAPVIVLREWVRVLKLGGIIAVTVPDAEYGMWAITGDYGKPGQLANKPGMEHYHVFDKTTLKLLFEFAGMEIVKCEIIDRRPHRPERTILCVGKKTESYKK